jgi:hypothetical protein
MEQPWLVQQLDQTVQGVEYGNVEALNGNGLIGRAGSKSRHLNLRHRLRERVGIEPQVTARYGSRDVACVTCAATGRSMVVSMDPPGP